MKMLEVRRGFTLLGLLLASTFAFGCDELPAGTSLWIRLTSPLSSFSARRGDQVSAILTEEIKCGDTVVFPVGSRLQGSVRSVCKVGLGIRHETASLEIAFTGITYASDPSVQIQTKVAGVENARESVKNGVIHGIRSTDTPQGRINSRLKHLPAWNPYSDAGLIAFKLSFPVFPEPEIYYGPGTDLRLVLTEPLASPPAATNAGEVPSFREEEIPALMHLIASLPERSTTTNFADADVTNVVFLGSRAQVEAAFRAAGWSRSAIFTPRSLLHNFYAFLDNSSYPQAPMRPMLVDGAPADMNWERSLNSYAKRDHLRMWQSKESWEHEPVWLSTSTRDTSATLSLRYRRFVHHIDANLDAERAKVFRDLTVAGCVSQMDYLQRSGLPHITKNATGDTMRTDGAVAVLKLRDCQPTIQSGIGMFPGRDFHAGNHFFRFARRQILTFRSDIWRANIIYGAYDLGRMTVTTLHPKLQYQVEEDNTTHTNPRPRIVAVGQPQDTAGKVEAEPRSRTGERPTSSLFVAGDKSSSDAHRSGTEF